MSDCKIILEDGISDKVAELEGANPSAEGGEEDYAEEGSGEMVHDIEESFQLQWLKDDMKPSKDAFKSHLKSKMLRIRFNWRCKSNIGVGYVKQVNEKLKAKNASEEEIKKFQAGAAGAVKKLLRNYDNYDVLMGSSMNPDAM